MKVRGRRKMQKYLINNVHFVTEFKTEVTPWYWSAVRIGKKEFSPCCQFKFSVKVWWWVGMGEGVIFFSSNGEAKCYAMTQSIKGVYRLEKAVMSCWFKQESSPSFAIANMPRHVCGGKRRRLVDLWSPFWSRCKSCI